MLKAAQTAIAQGRHFAIVTAADTEAGTGTNAKRTEPCSDLDMAFTTSPGSVNSFVKPGEDVFVRFCKGDCQGMLPAAQIVNNLGPKYLPQPAS